MECISPKVIECGDAVKSDHDDRCSGAFGDHTTQPIQNKALLVMWIQGHILLSRAWHSLKETVMTASELDWWPLLSSLNSKVTFLKEICYNFSPLITSIYCCSFHVEMFLIWPLQKKNRQVLHRNIWTFVLLHRGSWKKYKEKRFATLDIKMYLVLHANKFIRICKQEDLLLWYALH